MRLTVANWNLWGRWGEPRSPDIVSELASHSADIVGLVEVWRQGDELQVEQLAEALGYPHWAYAELDSGASSGEPWGVGLLSRLPIEDELRVEFPNPNHPQSPGVALITTVRSDEGPLDVVCLCEWGLSWSGYGADGTSDRLASYQFLARALLDRRREIAPIVVGDFNNVPEGRELRALTGKDLHGSLAMSFMDAWEFANGAQGGWTFDAQSNAHLRARPFGRHRIDYILTGSGPSFRGLWRANEVAVFGQTGASGMPPSDHYGVVAKLELVSLFGEIPIEEGDGESPELSSETLSEQRL
jgi:endonuclease/exonuclease/phosphatase family metal-dependent hydrolase